MKTKHGLWPALSVTFLLAACARAAPAATGTPVSTATPEPTAMPAGVTLTYGDNAQVELVTPAGRRVFIDVWNPDYLAREPSADDVLLVTHTHTDHYFNEFERAFPGKKIVQAEGAVEFPDVRIASVVSAHAPGDALEADKASNFLFIIDTGDLRIVHFGDCGQSAFTADQLAAIGSVDLAVSQFNLMDKAGRVGFNLMDQVKPLLILPTHYNRAALETALGLWPGFFAKTRTVSLTKAAVPETTSLLVMGTEYIVAAYAKIYNLAEWK